MNTNVLPSPRAAGVESALSPAVICRYPPPSVFIDQISMLPFNEEPKSIFPSGLQVIPSESTLSSGRLRFISIASLGSPVELTQKLETTLDSTATVSCESAVRLKPKIPVVPPAIFLAVPSGTLTCQISSPRSPEASLNADRMMPLPSASQFGKAAHRQ